MEITTIAFIIVDDDTITIEKCTTKDIQYIV